MTSANSGWTELPQGERESRWLPHALLGAIVAFFLFAFGWAALTQLDEVARGEGRIITQSQVQVIQNLEGGILGEILVREGDIVEKDQVLIRIDPTRYVAAYREGEQGALALKARIARLDAEANGKRFVMPAEVTKGNPSLAEQERALYDTRQRDLAGKNEILRQQLAQRQSELTELQNRERGLTDSLGLIRREIAITAPLVKQGVMSEIELLRQEREASRIRTELDATTTAVPRLRAAIAEARKKMEDSELAFRSQSGVELTQTRAELSKVSEGLPALEDRVSRATVRAPVRGIIRTIPNKTVGGVVQPGSPMAEIVPLEETLLVETRLKPSDIAFVHVGQRAVVKISAYDFSIYGGLVGKIEYVSADSMQPQQGGDPYYVAHVRTASNSIAYHGRELRVMPGMTASVDVLTGKRSVLAYILKPVNRARERAMTER